MKKKMMKLLLELLKDSKRSDRELAKVLGVSQPTVSRMRSKLVKEGVIKSFTVIPDFVKMGYEILAITLVKTKTALGLEDTYEAAHERGIKWLMEQPNIIMSGGCRGMGVDGFIISVHKSYSDFNEFMFKHKRQLGDQVDNVQTVLVDLGGSELLKPLNLKYLAEIE